MYRKPTSRTATIANGASTSDVVDLQNYAMTGIILPAAFDGTAITVTACRTRGGTYRQVYDSDGNPISLAVAAARSVGLSGAEADAISAFQHIKFVSNATEGAERLIDVVLK